MVQPIVSTLEKIDDKVTDNCRPACPANDHIKWSEKVYSLPFEWLR